MNWHGNGKSLLPQGTSSAFMLHFSSVPSPEVPFCRRHICWPLRIYSFHLTCKKQIPDLSNISTCCGPSRLGSSMWQLFGFQHFMTFWNMVRPSPNDASVENPYLKKLSMCPPWKGERSCSTQTMMQGRVLIQTIPRNLPFLTQPLKISFSITPPHQALISQPLLLVSWSVMIIKEP